ncbi:hypothetical protein Hdeb2414_s0009g00301051 [Helianthus debilis subsp. tardiflorus]
MTGDSCGLKEIVVVGLHSVVPFEKMTGVAGFRRRFALCGSLGLGTVVVVVNGGGSGGCGGGWRWQWWQSLEKMTGVAGFR